jgi:solute:Na+ symporter, SSS family
LVGWVAGCAMIWSSLFTVGNFLYGRYTYALGLGAVFVISGLILLKVVNKLWTGKSER